MFFHYKNFQKELAYMTQDQLEHITRVANEVINEHGVVCWGRAGNDGSINNFTSVKRPTDTHVGIVIGVREMAAFEPDATPVKRNRLDEFEELTKDELLKKREEELRQLREIVAKQPPKQGGGL
jgi:hypothetical protein